jgi:hypothetical protein
VDPRKMAKITFYHSSFLQKIYTLPDEGKLQHKYYTVEYLAVGAVKLNECNSHVMLFHNLVRDGLYKLFPHLDHPDKKSGLYSSP